MRSYLFSDFIFRRSQPKLTPFSLFGPLISKESPCSFLKTRKNLCRSFKIKWNFRWQAAALAFFYHKIFYEIQKSYYNDKIAYSFPSSIAPISLTHPHTWSSIKLFVANQDYNNNNNNKGYTTTMTQIYKQHIWMRRRWKTVYIRLKTCSHNEPDNNVIKRDLFIYSTKWLSCCCLKHDPIL